MDLDWFIWSKVHKAKKILGLCCQVVDVSECWRRKSGFDHILTQVVIDSP